MNEVEHALSQIADIRAQMSASSRFRGFAPEAMGFNALLCLGVAVAQSAWPQALAGNPVRYVAVWAAAQGACTLVSATEAVARSRSLHGGMAQAMLGSTVRLLLPFAAAAAVIAFVVCRFAPASAWMIPGIWEILVALAGFSVAASLPRGILWACAWYFVCGAVVLALGARSGALSPWMMGGPFTLGLAAVAFILHRENGDRHVRP